MLDETTARRGHAGRRHRPRSAGRPGAGPAGRTRDRTAPVGRLDPADDQQDPIHPARPASPGSVRLRIQGPIPAEAAEYLAACPIGDALLIQDYGKGVCTAPLLRSLLPRATAAGVPILVDPARGRDWRDSRGCSVIKKRTGSRPPRPWDATSAIRPP